MPRFDQLAEVIDEPPVVMVRLDQDDLNRLTLLLALEYLEDEYGGYDERRLEAAYEFIMAILPQFKSAVEQHNLEAAIEGQIDDEDREHEYPEEEDEEE